MGHINYCRNGEKMISFFYYTRNILGLILVISPLAGFLYIDYNFTLSMIFFCAFAAGVPLGSACYRLINFRLWTGFACTAACLGALLLYGDNLWAGGAAQVIGIAFVGLYAGGLIAIVPANLLISWFKASKTLLMGIVFSISIILGIPFAALMERHTYPALALGLLAMLTGCLFCLQRPPLFLGMPVLYHDKKFKLMKRPTVIKLFIFVMAVSFAAGLSLFNSVTAKPFNHLISTELIFILGLSAGAFAAGLISEFKSIYSGCILIIFLAELSVFSFDGGSASFQIYVNVFSQGMFLSAMTAVIPIAVYYICGPADYNSCLCKVWAAFPLGLASAGALVFAGSASIGTSILMSQKASICLMALLIASFFTIFSTWKHRFVLLK